MLTRSRLLKTRMVLASNRLGMALLSCPALPRSWPSWIRLVLIDTEHRHTAKGDLE